MDARCRQIRLDILKNSHVSGHGHIPTCFSVVELMTAVYDRMKKDPKNPALADRDLFILSKGHAALAHYSTLARFGYFAPEAVQKFGAFMGMFGCHADRLKVPGVEFSTGSLGHGIGFAVGAALGIQKRKTNRQVYTLVGDGESNEGTVWEALMVAADLKLSNLTILFDFNRSQGRSLQIERMADKVRAFGCDTHEVDGHDLAALEKALAAPCQTVKAVVANTVKGRGCALLEKNFHEWHRKSPTAEELATLERELHA